MPTDPFDAIKSLNRIDEDVIKGARKQVIKSTDLIIVTVRDSTRDASFFLTRLGRELRNLIQWNGTIIGLGPDEKLSTLSEPAARELYLQLKDRFEGVKATNGEILIGQIWKSNDRRNPGRKVEVVQIGNTHAIIKNTTSGVKTRVSIAGFKDKSRGYSLVECPG